MDSSTARVSLTVLFPEHYEPVETPVRNHGFSGQLSNPCAKIPASDMDKIALPADPKYPIVLTTYSMTEHWCGGSETRNVPSLLEAEPQLYVEMSHELAAEKGIKNGDPVIVESIARQGRGGCHGDGPYNAIQDSGKDDPPDRHAVRLRMDKEGHR